MSEPLLSVQDLAVSFATEQGPLTAVDGVSFDVPAGRTVALVGESGCGKTVTAHAIMRLLPSPPASVDHGRIVFRGRDLNGLSGRQMRKVRGREIAIVFQDPMTALNPVYSIGSQLVEAIRIHERLSRRQARKRAVDLLERVGFPEPAARFGDFPHELSGGMRQRVMIAMALACSPALVIADEPTTALDMLASAQIRSLLRNLKRDSDLSLLLISHDFGMVSQLADEIVVLYAGQVVEQGSASLLLGTPHHPYTAGLLHSIPPAKPRRRRRRPTPTRLKALRGVVPDPHELPDGCRFANRCPEAMDHCHAEAPPVFEMADGRSVRCFLYQEEEPLPLSSRPPPPPPSGPELDSEPAPESEPLPEPEPEPESEPEPDSESEHAQ
jgi:oligopeptide/dipeptide ABC transporter ATP-binding protein